MENIQEKWNDLKSWIESFGGFLHPNIELRQTPVGRSVFSTGQIDGKVFNLTKTLCLNAENSGVTIDSEVFNFKESVVIALLTEYYKPNSFWTPYLNLLPHLREFSTHPIFLRHIGKFPNVSPTISQVVEICYQEFQKFEENLQKYISQTALFENCQTSDILWAYLCVITRMWSSLGLVPFADLLQHSNESEMAINAQDDQLFMTGSFIEGQELFDNYCLDDDQTLFTNFGFVESSNLSLLSVGFLFEERPKMIQVLIDSILQTADIKKLILTNRGINVQLMRYLRLNFLDSHDLKLVDLADDNIGVDIITLGNELKCLKKIKYSLSNLFPVEAIDLATSQIVNYEQGTPEYMIFKFILRVDDLKTSLDAFIDEYWMNFLSN